MTKVNIICTGCKKEFSRDLKVYNRDIKEGKEKFYCSKQCLIDSTKAKEVTRNCKFCGSEFISSEKSKHRTCCSQECAKKEAQKYVNKQAISCAMKNWQENLKINSPDEWKEYRKKISDGQVISNKKRAEERKNTLDSRNFDSVCYEVKRKRIIDEQQGKCAHCSLSEWRGVKITLEIDHINGDNKDDRRENLEAVCPNCHSITPTFRSKNKRNVKKVTDEEAINALKTEISIRQALIKCGLTPKGGNYKRFSRLKETIKS